MTNNKTEGVDRVVNEIRCAYPNTSIPPMTKKDIEQIKAFGKIVLNYLKIKRLQNEQIPKVFR